MNTDTTPPRCGLCQRELHPGEQWADHKKSGEHRMNLADPDLMATIRSEIESQLPPGYGKPDSEK